MDFGNDSTGLLFVAMVAIAVGGLFIGFIYPMLAGNASSSRLKAVSGAKRDGNSWRARFQEDTKDTRRKQIQESLNQIGEKAKKKKRISLALKLAQAGLEMKPKSFYLFSLIFGLVCAAVSFVLGAPLFVVGLAMFGGTLGLPRWVLSFLLKRRQNKFLNDFADAIDVLVRGLKSGLPVTEAMKIISTEQGPPVGPEFMEVVEGQRIGIPIDQGVERMVERMPLPEVNFLAIVMTIQSKTGGNLSEALANLSRVLRDRKKMKQKIQSVSQEAKSSAAIIGSLPFVIIGIMSFVNPSYMLPMFHTSTGHMLLTGSAIWMSLGVLVMRKMINFQF